MRWKSENYFNIYIHSGCEITGYPAFLNTQHHWRKDKFYTRISKRMTCKNQGPGKPNFRQVFLSLKTNFSIFCITFTSLVFWLEKLKELGNANFLGVVRKVTFFRNFSPYIVIIQNESLFQKMHNMLPFLISGGMIRYTSLNKPVIPLWKIYFSKYKSPYFVPCPSWFSLL